MLNNVNPRLKRLVYADVNDHGYGVYLLGKRILFLDEKWLFLSNGTSFTVEDVDACNLWAKMEFGGKRD